MINKLSNWAKLLKKLGFRHKNYEYLDSELVSVHWYKERLHVSLGTRYTDEYLEYLNENYSDGEKFNINWTKCEVVDITIYTNEFGYPEGCFEDGNWQGGISLSAINYYENFTELTYENFMKALYMAENPIEAKIKIVSGFIKEVELFLSKHRETLHNLGWYQFSNSLLCVGELSIETAPYIIFKHPEDRDLYDLNFHYNIFTDKLIFDFVEKTNNRLEPCKYHEQNVNELSVEEVKEQIIKFMNDHEIK